MNWWENTWSVRQRRKKELRRFCRQYFGKNAWKGSIFELYREFLGNQAKKGKTVPFTEGAYDVYDLAALGLSVQTY